MRSESSTPVRRMKHCRIMVGRGWAVPTLIAYPPPPPESARSRPIMALPRVQTPVPAPARPPWEERSARSRRRDCVFIPDMDVVLEFIEARRRAAGMGRFRALDEPLPRVPTTQMDTPLVLGLLMTVLPPLAVTMVWSSTRLPRAAQIALTLYGALTTIVFAAIAVAALT
ncbi:MAG TPA: hypothetical protein VGL81_26455 [Polyangiaceae bacterium]